MSEKMTSVFDELKNKFNSNIGRSQSFKKKQSIPLPTPLNTSISSSSISTTSTSMGKVSSTTLKRELPPVPKKFTKSISADNMYADTNPIGFQDLKEQNSEFTSIAVPTLKTFMPQPSPPPSSLSVPQVESYSSGLKNNTFDITDNKMKNKINSIKHLEYMRSKARSLYFTLEGLIENKKAHLYKELLDETSKTNLENNDSELKMPQMTTSSASLNVLPIPMISTMDNTSENNSDTAVQLFFNDVLQNLDNMILSIS